MIKILLLAGLSLGVCGNIQAQVLKVDTAFTTDIGSSGKPASCAFTASLNSTYGINHNRNFFFLLGEDFTVPTGQTWNLDTVIVYGYQTGSGTSVSPLNFATLQIRQSAISGNVVFGDTTTNRLATSSWTGIYRVDKNNLTGIDRPIMQMKIKLTPTKTLTAGTYWLIWGCKGSGTGGVFCPPKVNPGRANPPGQNAMQHSPGVANWHAASDTITGPTAVPVGFSYMLKGPQKTGGGVGVQEPDAITLLQHQPNPFSGSATISFHLANGSPVKLDVYNSVGQLVKTLLDNKLEAGRQEITFNAAGLAAGKYYYRLQTPTGTLTRPMDVLK